MELIRTFHPIGQGAFYSERHIFNTTEFTVVYDCGSSTLKGKKLEAKITSSFPENQIINILFISHFHADHINGIEYLKKHCKIKRVVLPLLHEDSKTILKAINLLENNNIDPLLIDNPTEYFGDETTTIFVNQTNTDENSNGVNLEDIADISTLNSTTTIPSGKLIVSGVKSHDWIFIPFNYKQVERKNQFISSLATESLTLDDINTIDKITANKDKIKRAYNAIDGDLNENSMLLFSGERNNNHVNCFSHTTPFHYFYYFDKIKSGCIYFGDISLKQIDIITDIRRKLVRLLSNVGTIQVPHHGSIQNFEKSILSIGEIKLAIISFGTTNSYGHPSDIVVGEIISSSVIPLLVTEKQETMITQWK
jgi:beta-lactamase superfamily II metal-dependent hydrolase